MSNFIDDVLSDLYSGDRSFLDDSEMSRLIACDEVDEYVEESVRIFLNEMHTISYLPSLRIRLNSSILISTLFGKSLMHFSQDSVCYASYLVCIADKTDWMKYFLSGVGLRTGNIEVPLHHESSESE